MSLIIYPSSMLRIARIDEAFASEAKEFDTYSLFSLDEQRLILRGNVIKGQTVFYRGWILTENDYKSLEYLVTAAGGTLLNDSKQYSNAQFGNYWLQNFSDFTPKTVILPYSVSHKGIKEASEKLNSNSFILKGVSKSLKHDWDNSMFASNVDRLTVILDNFRKQVTEDEENLLLLREFEEWLPGEIRTWWFNGELTGYHLHPQSPRFKYDMATLTNFLKSLESSAKTTSNALTIDVVRNVDNEWRVVEVGSASVSETRGNFKLFLNIS